MIEDTPQTVKDQFLALKKAFKVGKTHDIEWRKTQIKQVILAFEEMEDEICDVLKKDLGREEFYSRITEIEDVIHRAKTDLKNIDEYVKDEKRDTPIQLAPAKSRIVFQPLGSVCVLGCSNFPVAAVFSPMVCALKAGNCVLIKPSELTPNSSALCRKMVNKYLDNECIKIVEGSPEVSKACTEQAWDKIVFTGSPTVGKLVAQAAAKNLTPCILELGGKSPTIVDESANAKFAGLKTMSARLINSGQVCISPDYAYVHESKKDEFIKSCMDTIKELYGEDPKTSKYYSRMVNEVNCERVLSLLEDHGGKVLTGGEGDVSDKYVAPTIVDAPSLDSRLMKEEIFGPILPVITFKDFDEVVDHLNEREKPLALYYFGSVFSKNKEYLEKKVQSGSMVVNETIIQAFNPCLPFGGVGNSGYGKLVGRDGFRNLSNEKSVIVKPTIDIDSANKMVLPPFTDEEKKSVMNALALPYYQSHVQKLLLVILVVIALLSYLFLL